MTSQTVLKRSDLLKQCVDIRAEIKQLEREITELRSRKWQFGTDCVIGSSKCEPYQQHAITIGSFNPSPEVTRGVNSRIKKIEAFKVKLVQHQNDAEDYLQTLPTSIERIILRGYYIEGKEWQDVAAELTENSGKDFTEDAVRKRAKRFFEKN